METIELTLNKNLRKSILRGHPWIYQNAIIPGNSPENAKLARLKDRQKNFLAWGIYDPRSPLAFRVLSLFKSKPDMGFYKKRMAQAFEKRQSLLSQVTKCYRLFNGEGDGLPGLVCDVYNSVAVVQFDGEGPRRFWYDTKVLEELANLKEIEAIVEKPRGDEDLIPIHGKINESLLVSLENGMKFFVDISKGQKTGFFLDQRDNRKYLSQWVRGKRFLNCFSYTGGFSIAAGVGGASHVTSYDISQKALTLAEENWELNSLPKEGHSQLKGDIFRDLKFQKKKWDAIVVDPPSMAKSEKQKSSAITKYIHLFAEAIHCLEPGGDLFLSSCSSHISFEDFYDIAVEGFSKARRNAKILRISGQGPDHPFPLACPELRYLKFIHLKADGN